MEKGLNTEGYQFFRFPQNRTCDVLINYSVPLSLENKRCLRSRKHQLQVARLRVCAFYFLGRQDFRSPRSSCFAHLSRWLLFCYTGSHPVGEVLPKVFGVDVQPETWNLHSFSHLRDRRNVIPHQISKISTLLQEGLQIWQCWWGKYYSS